MDLQGLLRRVVYAAKKIIMVSLMALLPLFGVDVHKHLANPGTGLGAVIAKRILKNNKSSNERLLQLLKYPENAKVVEIGFGLGDTLKQAIEIAPRTAKFWGFELSQSMLDHATQNLGDSAKGQVNLSIRDVGVDGLPFCDGEIDVVYHANVIYFVPDPAFFVRETCRVLKPNGVLGMSIVQPKEFNDPVGPDSPFKNKFEGDEIRALCLAQGFSKVEIEPFKDAIERMLVVATK